MLTVNFKGTKHVSQKWHLVKLVFHLNVEVIKAIVIVYIPIKRQPNVTEELDDLFITMIKLGRTF